MNLPTGEWTLDDLNATWEVVRWFLGENQIWIMLAAAIILAFPVTDMILNLFRKATQGNRKYDDEDDEVEYW